MTTVADLTSILKDLPADVLERIQKQAQDEKVKIQKEESKELLGKIFADVEFEDATIKDIMNLLAKHKAQVESLPASLVFKNLTGSVGDVKVGEKTKERMAAVLKYLKDNPGSSAQDIKKGADAEKGWNQTITALKAEKKVRWEGEKAATRYFAV